MALPPPKCGEIGAFYPVFERSELSAAERYTTQHGGGAGYYPQPLGTRPTNHVWTLREVLRFRVPPWPQPAGV